MADLLDELRWRGLLHQATDEDALREHLRRPRRVYAGFDPTADSLTVGNLVPIMLLRHFQNHGHQPVVVMGGGTGLIGDPSGKEKERALLDPESVERNIAGQRPIFERVLDFEGDNAAAIVNNHDWLKDLTYIEALRDIGKYFSVNEMMRKDSVRSRLEAREQGISYTEFSYMILQAYDFLRLYEDRNVTVQLGGSDQWGNILAGIDLISEVGQDISSESLFLFEMAANPERYGVDLSEEEKEEMEAKADKLYERYHCGGLTEEEYRHWKEKSEEASTPTELFQLARGGWESFGLTAPLVTRADGGKFGKTETGAVWLTAERTSPYAFYQFWLNTADADIPRYLKLFTVLGRDEIESLIAEHEKNPGAREAHRALASHVTELVHGAEARDHAERAARALFTGDVAQLDERTLNEIFAETPHSEHAKSDLTDGGLPMVELLPRTTLASSKREAREHLSAGAVSVNGRKVGLDARLTADDLLHGSVALLRRGKKTWHLTRWV